MTRLVASVAGSLALSLIAGAAPLAAQAGDATRVLADARAALGGEARLRAVRTFAATGRATRVIGDASSGPSDTEIAFELPDKFAKKEVMPLPVPTAAGITRTSGFNGETPIEIVDQPPAMPGMVIRFSAGEAPPGVSRTPEQEQEQRRRQLIAAKQELARLTLGFLAAPLDTYPMQFAYVGQAESPDGKAEVLDVTGEGGFAARLFIDSSTHLPLMLSWMAKEPLVIQRMAGPGGPGGGGHAEAPASGGMGHAAAAPGRRDGPPALSESERREAEQARRIVEYRVYYGDYQEVSGVKVPFRLRRSVDGKPTEEVVLEKVTINGKIDPRKFETK